MRFRVVYRRIAETNAADAAHYIAVNGSMERALRWFDGLEAAIESLAEMPRRFGAAREQPAVPGIDLRQMPYKSHRVIYMVREHEVHILHVRHTAQDELGSSDLGVPEADDPA